MKKTAFLFFLILSTLQALGKPPSEDSSTELKILRLRCMEQENKILDLQNQQRAQQEANQVNQAKYAELTASLEQKNAEISYLKQQLQSAQLHSQAIEAQKNSALIAGKAESNPLPAPAAAAMVETKQAQPVQAIETTPTNPPAAVENKTAPLESKKVYQVLAGDSLFKIATQFNVSMAELQKINKIKDPRKIQVGQSLIIPPAQEAK